MYLRQLNRAFFSFVLCLSLIMTSILPVMAAELPDIAADALIQNPSSEPNPDSKAAPSESSDKITPGEASTEAGTEIPPEEIPSSESAPTETPATETKPTEIGSSETESTESPLKPSTSTNNSKRAGSYGLETPDEITVLKNASAYSLYENVTDQTVYQGYYIRKVSAETILSRGAYNAIQPILNEAAENATSSLPYKIVIEPGSYKLAKRLNIFSNTYLHMEEVTFTQPSGTSSSMLKTGAADDDSTGYYYQNITLYGGTWNGNNNKGNTLLKIAHASNVSMMNQTVTNSVDGHLMETAGVDGLTIRKCNFSNQTISPDTTDYIYEAIQMDVLSKNHISGYRSEDLNTQNVVIDYCTFSNVPRGIGNHTATLNHPFCNISITNNSFNNIACAAVQLANVTGCQVTNNTIANASSGIVIYALPSISVYLASTLANEGNVPTSTPTSYIAPSLTQNIVIQYNSISCAGIDKYAKLDNTGILLSGMNVTEAYVSMRDQLIPSGDYYLSGAAVLGNTITTEKNGIILRDTKNSGVNGNIIVSTGTGNSGYGISFENGSTGNTAAKNMINRVLGTGIGVNSSSSVTTISENMIGSAGFCGLFVGDASVGTVKGNKFTNCCASSSFGAISICTSGKAETISQNQIQSSGSYGIMINGGTVAAIQNNTVKKPQNYGIITYNSAKVTSITGNTITGGNAMGIHIAHNLCKLQIANNTVKNCQTAQIYVNADSDQKLITIDNNTIGAKNIPKQSDGIRVDAGKVQIQNNKIDYCMHAIAMSERAIASIYKNTFKKHNADKIQVASENLKNVTTPSSVAATALGKNRIQLTWKRVNNITGYRIFRSTKKNGTYKRVANVSAKKTSYTDKKLKKDTRYYYKIVAVKKSANTQVTIYSTESNAIAKKTAKS